MLRPLTVEATIPSDPFLIEMLNSLSSIVSEAERPVKSMVICDGSLTGAILK